MLKNFGSQLKKVEQSGLKRAEDVINLIEKTQNEIGRVDDRLSTKMKLLS